MLDASNCSISKSINAIFTLLPTVESLCPAIFISFFKNIFHGKLYFLAHFCKFMFSEKSLVNYRSHCIYFVFLFYKSKRNTTGTAIYHWFFGKHEFSKLSKNYTFPWNIFCLKREMKSAGLMRSIAGRSLKHVLIVFAIAQVEASNTSILPFLYWLWGGERGYNIGW